MTSGRREVRGKRQGTIALSGWPLVGSRSLSLRFAQEPCSQVILVTAEGDPVVLERVDLVVSICQGYEVLPHNPVQPSP